MSFSHHLHRNTPVLATSLNCLLTLTTVVIGDIHNSELLRQLPVPVDDPYLALIQSAATHGGNVLSRSSDVGKESSKGNSSPLQWRVDVAQRIKQHLPSAYRFSYDKVEGSSDFTIRHVWNSMSITFVRYQTLLLDSLYHLICSSVRFLGTDVSAEFCLVLLEASYHSNNHIVSNTIKSYLRGLWRDIPTVQWLEMQSVFTQVSA